ncbi:MAG TPA: trypsin-like serine protease [Gaiellaceae bacterium]|nr:trypsin-like serine protease [Gaiellaceae bacterium]
MLKYVTSSVAALAVALVSISAAAAVTGGGVDGDAHPYVGALLVDGSVECSGVLVAPAVWATAGHCGAAGTRVAVSFDATLTAGSGFLGGTLVVDQTRGADLAVVLLDAPAQVAPARLPAADSVGSIGKGALVTTVGYGYSARASDGSFVYDGLRHVASSPVAKVSKSMLSLSTLTAGPCLGDSGGPQLLGSTVVSLTSSGSKDCAGKAEGYRLDTPAARAFLSRFVALP